MIGTMTGVEIDLLRMREQLRRIGTDAPPRLVWSVVQNEDAKVAPNPSALLRSQPSYKGPLIDLVISRCHQRQLRTIIRETVRAYRADVDSARYSHAANGMNWAGLALGGKIQGGCGVRFDRSFEQSRATATLKIIGDQLGSDQTQFLDRVLIKEQSRESLAQQYSIRPSLVESRALAALRELGEIYRVWIKNAA